MINKIIEDIKKCRITEETQNMLLKGKIAGFNRGINKAINVIENYEVEFHNYEMYSDLLEENEKLKEELKKYQEGERE